MSRDGFVIHTYDGEEVDFIACTYDGRMRDRVEEGLAMRVDLDRFTFSDTRDEENTDEG